MTGSDTWRTLLRRALRALDSVAESGQEIPAWTFGGGTVLMLRHEHRLSRDIDVFFTSTQVLTSLSPRLNDSVGALTDVYEERSSSLRLVFPDGEVDFIAAPRLLDAALKELDFEGRKIRLDPSAEIVAKKLFYRSAGLKTRDIFDLAVVLDREPDARDEILSVIETKLPVLLRRLHTLEPGFSERVRNEIALLPPGEAYADTCFESARRFFERK